MNFFRKHSFGNTIRVLNRLDPDQDRQNVGPELDPNCLQRLSTDYKSRHYTAGKELAAQIHKVWKMVSTQTRLVVPLCS